MKTVETATDLSEQVEAGADSKSSVPVPVMKAVCAGYKVPVRYTSPLQVHVVLPFPDASNREADFLEQVLENRKATRNFTRTGARGSGGGGGGGV